MFTMIASAPSSGSTLLADLLDSTPSSACGDELNIFSNRTFFEHYCDFRSHPFRFAGNSSVYTRAVHLSGERLFGYGLDKKKFRKLISDSGSQLEFIDNLASHFFSWRGKRNATIFFEKTPQNVNTIGQCLETLQEANVVFVVRNPAYVYASLLKRGFPSYIALVTWLVDVAAYARWRSHSRVHLLRYEDLVKEPYRVVHDLVVKMGGKAFSECEFRELYRNNQYRATYSRRLNGWGVKEVGEVRDANKKTLAGDLLSSLAWLSGAHLNERYAAIHDIEPISFQSALDMFGYAQEYSSLTGGIAGRTTKTVLDYRQLIKKWIADSLFGKAHLGDLGAYTNPVLL